MRITISARVDLGSSWDESSKAKQVVIDLEHCNKAPYFPWAQICEGLVEATIQERLAADALEEENEE